MNKKTIENNFDEYNAQESEPEGVDEIMKKTEQAFNSGNGNVSMYYLSPEERLREYLQFE